MAIPCWFGRNVTSPVCQCSSSGCARQKGFWLGLLVLLMASRAWLFLPATLSWLPICLLTKPERQICIWSGFCSLSTTSQLKRMAWDWDRPWLLFFCQSPILLLSSTHWCLSVALSISFPTTQRNFLVKGAEHWDHEHLKDKPIHSGVLQLGSCSLVLHKRIQNSAPIPL